MEYISGKSMINIANQLKFAAISKEVITEMGEPIIYNKNQTWFFAYQNSLLAGFICHNEKSILYAYVFPDYRLKGVFKGLYEKLPKQKWNVVSSNASLPFFLKNGFKITKSFKNCHKINNYDS